MTEHPIDKLFGLILDRRAGQPRYTEMRALTSGEYAVVRDNWDRRNADRRQTRRGDTGRRRA